jgi:hypothetical protein
VGALYADRVRRIRWATAGQSSPPKSSNEFLKEHRKVQELLANAARLQKQIDALTAGLQKVAAELEVSRPAPQTVLNNR